MKNKPIDIVLSLLPNLTETEKKKVRKALQMTEQTACERLGHNFRALKAVSIGGFWKPAEVKITMFCNRCGETRDE